MITKVILIDPTTKMLREHMFDSTKDGFHGTLINVTSPGGSMPVKDESGCRHMMWSGLYHYSPDMIEMPESFQVPALFGDAVFFGKCVFIGYELDGSNRTDVRYPLEYFTKHLRLLTKEQSVIEYEKIMERYENLFEL